MLDLLNTAAVGTRVTIGHCRRREHKRKRTGCLLPRRTAARAAKHGPEIVLNELILNNTVVISSSTCSFRRIKSMSLVSEKEVKEKKGWERKKITATQTVFFIYFFSQYIFSPFFYIFEQSTFENFLL